MFHGHVERDAARWEKPCEICLGERCEACEKKGWVWESQAPSSLLTLEGRDLFKAYRLMKEYQMLPVAGAQANQTAVFLEAVNLCDAVHSVYSEKKAAEAAERERQEKRKVKLLGEL